MTDAGDRRHVIVDTDTAGDDTQALLLLATAERIDLEGVTICAGNVEFDYQVENAKYALNLVDDETTVYEGAREPLSKEHDFADYVHGEGGLGGDLFPDTGIPSGDRHAAEYIVETARKHPGEITLACIAPLTNVALALRLEPDLNDLLDEVWVMGGSANHIGNVTPAAEYNFWVDPDAAKMALCELEVTLFDWGLTVRDTGFDAATLGEFASGETKLSEFFAEITGTVREFTRESLGEDMTTQPDSALAAALVDRDLIEETGHYHVDVDEREGLTRGYSAVDETGVTDGEARTTVVESIDSERFEALFRAMLFEGRPEAAE
jgi:purine nucleosidase